MRNAEIREFCKLDGPTLDLLRAAVAQSIYPHGAITVC